MRIKIFSLCLFFAAVAAFRAIPEDKPTLAILDIYCKASEKTKARSRTTTYWTSSTSRPVHPRGAGHDQQALEELELSEFDDRGREDGRENRGHSRRKLHPHLLPHQGRGRLLPGHCASWKLRPPRSATLDQADGKLQERGPSSRTRINALLELELRRRRVAGQTGRQTDCRVAGQAGQQTLTGRSYFYDDSPEKARQRSRGAYT